ncbi:hypothetical protein FOZ63_016295 [Perkinsus olseni]|uniref:C2H2-type domain-containing protein n=1 Tax=Perkinsus olseni TaxID=32597 RepID=A0A7J6Q0F2_PEROL|nr:hypothetical protein FOZ63_016295 [Perkinsus olseni]
MLSSHPPSSSVTTADQLVARTIELSPFQPASVSAAASNGGRVLLTSPEQREAAPRWEEHPCDLCKCVLYSAEELRNHVNGKRHQKALRNRDWFKAQEEKRLATVNEHEVFLASSSHSNINENTNRAVVNDKDYTPSSHLMRQCPSDWEVTAEGFKCTICGCTVNSEGCMDMHLLGSGHRKKKESLQWQRRATATTTATTTTTPSSQQQQQSASSSMTTTPPSSDDVAQGDNWDLSQIPVEERCFIRWDDQRGYVCSCCDAACCTVEILQIHLQGKKHTSKSKWYKTMAQHQQGDGSHTATATAAVTAGESIGLVIFEDHTIWEETNTGWRCKLCDAAVNSDSMGMAHMSSRKHQTNLAWASTTSAATSSAHQNNNPVMLRR